MHNFFSIAGKKNGEFRVLGIPGKKRLHRLVLLPFTLKADRSADLREKNSGLKWLFQTAVSSKRQSSHPLLNPLFNLFLQPLIPMI